MKKDIINFSRNKKKKKRNVLTGYLGIPFYLLVVILIIIPIGLLMIYSFQVSDAKGTFSINFTLINFVNFFKEPSFLKTMGESLYIAGISTIFTLLIGYPLAYFISRTKRKNQSLLIILVTSPMWINMLLRANALQQLFDMINPKLIGSNFAIIVGMIYVFLPFMILPIYTSLSKIDYNLLEAASDLGANKTQKILKVVIPLSLSGVLSGIMMVFLPAATTLVIPKYLGKNKYMIGNLIEGYIKIGNIGGGAAISLILAIVMMTFVGLIRKIDNEKGIIDNE